MIRHILGRRPFLPYNSTMERAIPRAKRVKAERKKAQVASLEPSPIVKEVKSISVTLKYPLQKLPSSDKPSGWLDPIGGTDHLPFKIIRTQSKQLPVYSDLKNGATRRLTILRRYVGDSNEIVEELQRLIPNATVEEKLGRIEVSGHHVYKIKRWLKRLGF